MRRPASLAELARLAVAGVRVQHAMAEFLDQFALEKRVAMLTAEPELLAGHIPDGDVIDAYLAAVAVSLSRSIGTVPPAWTWQERRKLRQPWFAHPGPALRATLILESPAAFRERNLFVSANVLSRA